MQTYTPPIRDMQFVLTELNDLDAISALPGYADANADLLSPVLQEAGRLASQVLAPINASGDQEGAKWKDGVVTSPAGFKAAYDAFCAGGWNGFEAEPEFGGQGMPRFLGAAVLEMWRSSNLAFSLMPLLTAGAIEALQLRGSPQLQQMFLAKMVSGEWTGTMNLTEPQAGTDLGLIKTKAVRQPDGRYKLSGQKIFITYGEHDLAENIVHLVLARTPEAPAGVKGISIFVVPKMLVNPDGSLGARNDISCVSIEHKLGIHASPTCVLSYGDQGGSIGYIVGEENTGLATMFIMMNKARFAVGMEGLGSAELAYQKALGYARNRVQSRDLSGGNASVPIINHPDVRRMLMWMKSHTEAMRALAYTVAWHADFAAKHPDAAARKQHQALVDFFIPIVKGWSTEVGIHVASLGIQIHGGMGYMEETGAAQIWRDSRIATIYEGTTAIQANDLIGRKLAREGGATLNLWIAMLNSTVQALETHDNAQIQQLAPSLAEASVAVREAGAWLAENYGNDIKGVHAGAVPFLELCGIAAGTWLLAKSALIAANKIANGSKEAFYQDKIHTVTFFAAHVSSHAHALSHTIRYGANAVLAGFS